jgi:hypothetical protein
MSAEQIDYPAVLADLKAKRALLDQAIAAVEAIVSGGAPALPSAAKNGLVGPNLPREIKPDTFYGLSILDASKKYLAMTGEAQTTEQLADALNRGGLLCKPGSVAAILQRAVKIKDGELRRVGRGRWGLATWYGR